MPPIRKHRDPFIEHIVEMREEFEAGFERSRKGNLWRHWDGKTVSVFKRRDGYFGWSIADEDAPRFSSRGYEDEEIAVGALAEELGVGW